MPKISPMWKSKEIEVPIGFDFVLAAKSHGWYDLAPFRFDDNESALFYTFPRPGGKAIEAKISRNGKRLLIELDASVPDASPIPELFRHILRVDDLIGEFHAIAAVDDRLTWAAERGAGRMLRSPTVFEDMVKTLCTTNCSWSLTRNMIDNLVNSLGAKSSSGSRSFPNVESMAQQNEAFYRDVVRAGYRSSYFVEMTGKIASGTIDPQKWLDPEIPLEELRKEIKSLKGFGNYAVDNLMKLVGRYDGLALDSFLRSQFYARHNRGKKCTDKKIETKYKRYGKWKGLAIWCDMTSDWHDPSK